VKRRAPAPPEDASGRRLRAGDRVRVLAVPDLSGMAPASLAESRPVFEHLVGTYRRIQGFDRQGNAELVFRIRRGENRGLHWVWIEPWLLRRVAERPAARRRRSTPP
jgi:hypothetical protein